MFHFQECCKKGYKQILKCSIFRSVADDVAAAIVSHWNGDYLYESENRYIHIRKLLITGGELHSPSFKA